MPNDPEDDDELEPETLSNRDRLRQEALSLKHILAHTPKNPFCQACKWAIA